VCVCVCMCVCLCLFNILVQEPTSAVVSAPFHSMDTRLQVPLPELKRPEHEVEHKPPASAEVKNEWRYTPPPLYVLMAWTGRTLT
jgi:hypothetical protein